MSVGAASGESFGADEDGAARLSPLTLNWRGAGNAEKTSIFLFWQPRRVLESEEACEYRAFWRRAARL